MRTITASKARQGFAELLESVDQGPVVIERQRRGVAVVMSWLNTGGCVRSTVLHRHGRLLSLKRRVQAPLGAWRRALVLATR
mgnify:CR=1 FL=1